MSDAADPLWSPERRQLTIGLLLTITLVAFEALAVATVMPRVKDDLGGLGLYGWVFSGFFLASLVGIVVSGQLADRRGLVLPYAAGLTLFAAGLVVGGLAPSMPVLVAARAAQGFGAGAIPAVAYTAIGRGYPPIARPRMFATMSTAWVVPGLIGPAVATVVEHAIGWRAVFLGLVPLVVVAALLAMPALASVEGHGPPAVDGEVEVDGDGDAARPAEDRARLRRVLVLVIGVGAVLGAGTVHLVAATVALVLIGVPVAVWAFIGLVPPGTLRLAPGVPATVAVRGLLTCALFSADAYVPLTLVTGRGAQTWVAGVTLTAISLTWAGGSWVQARTVQRLGPRHLDRIGFALVAAGSALMLVVALGAWVGLAVVAWGIAGLGIGIAYAPLSATVLASAVPGEEGQASASLQLSDTLGIAVGTGVGGWIVSAADTAGWTVAHGTAVVFAFSIAVAGVGFAGAARLPGHLPDPTP